LDLAALEAEAFLLGIWKDFAELEESLSMDELTAVLEASRDHTHEERKFFAALKGVDLDKETGGRSSSSGSGNAWEDMKARVFSGGAAKDSRDIVSLQGATGKKAGMQVGASPNSDIQYSKVRGGGW
jgi:hypothetical protein